MQLEKYNVQLRVEDPDDPETNVTLAYKGVPRDKVLLLTVKYALEMLENAVE